MGCKSVQKLLTWICGNICNVRFQNGVRNVRTGVLFLFRDRHCICAPFDRDLRSAIFLFMRNNVAAVEGIAKTAVPHVGRNTTTDFNLPGSRDYTWKRSTMAHCPRTSASALITDVPASVNFHRQFDSSLSMMLAHTDSVETRSSVNI